MRRYLCLLAIGMLLLSWAEVWSQGTSRFMGSGSRASSLPAGSLGIINKPIDTGLSLAPFPTQKKSFFSSLFHKTGTPTFPSVVGHSNLPSPKSFKSTTYPNTFKPLPPILPGQKTK
jgi:hypothetical protein